MSAIPATTQSLGFNVWPAINATSRTAAKKQRVLVVGSTPSFNWVTIRSLNKMGVRPHFIGNSPWTAYRLPLFTRSFRSYNSEQMTPDKSDDLGALNSKMADLISRQCDRKNIDVVIPTDLPTMLSLLANPDAVKGRKVLPLAADTIIRRLNHKWNFFQLLEEVDIPRPQTTLLESQEDAQKVDWPSFVVKPLCNANSAGVRVFDDRTELTKYLEVPTIFNRFPLLCQEFLPGQEYCACFFAVNGEVKAEAVFEDHQPNRIFRDIPEVSQTIARVVKAANYTGLGLMDVIKDDRDSLFKPLELNPRIWGSMLAPLDVGVNFIEAALGAVIAENASTQVIKPHLLDTEVRIPLFDRVLQRLSSPKHNY